MRIRGGLLTAIAIVAVAAFGIDYAAGTARADSAGVTVYVATNGNDSNPGTSASAPLATLAQAQVVVRNTLPSDPGPITVDVAGGTYHLSSTLAFTDLDSGTANSPVTWQAAPGQTVTISGGRLLTPGTWTPQSAGSSVMETTVQPGLDFDQLFVNGQRQILARYPNLNATATGLQGTATLSAANTAAANWTDYTMGDVRAQHCNNWGQLSYKITGYTNGQLQLHYVGDSNRSQDCHSTTAPTPGGVVVEGLPQLVTAPGDWWYDPTSGELLYYPPSGANLSTATFESAELNQLITLTGTSDTDPVQNITFNGFTFTGTHRALFNSTYVPDAKGDWAIDHQGAIHMMNSQKITVTNSSFDHLGGNGVFIDNYANGDTVSNSRFTGDGETDVQVVGSPTAVRDYSDGYYDSVPIDDLGSGPANNNYPRAIDITNNVMSNMGQFGLQSAGVNISMSEDVTVDGNTISGSPRACLNLEDGTWGGDVIENNTMFNCVSGTGDNGSINVWGRDRYWASSGNNTLASGVTFEGNTGGKLTDAQAKDMMLLDAVKPFTIQHNLIEQTNGSWAIDLDDGSSNFVIKDNLVLDGGIKLRDGFNRTVENNVITSGAAGAGIFEQVSHSHNGDVIEHNITLGREAYSNTQNNPVTAAYTIDSNLFWNAGNPLQDNPTGSGNENLSSDGKTLNTTSTWVKDGMDVHSQVGNPAFTSSNPGTSFDFTVGAGSPALALGYQNFSMTGFGATGGPMPPAYTIPYGGSTGSGVPPIYSQPELLMGATATNITSAAIESSLGIADDYGLYLTTIPATSYAATVGLQADDDIRSINGTQVTDDRNTFWIPYNSLPAGAPIALVVRRGQNNVTLNFTKTTAREELNDTSGMLYPSTGNGSASRSWIWRGSSAGGSGSYQNDIWATQNIGDSWSLTFNGTGIDIISETNTDEGNVALTLDGHPYQTISFVTSQRTYQATVLSISGLEPGVHTIGGTMATGSYMIVDAFETLPAPATAVTPASVSVSASPSAPTGANGWYDTQPVTLTATVTPGTNPNPTLQASIDGGPFKTITSGQVQLTTDGRHTVQFQAVDPIAVGNPGATSSTVTVPVNIDTTPPVTSASVSPTPSGGAVNGPATITLSATDPAAADGSPGSGVAGTEYRIDGGAWQAYTAAVQVTSGGVHSVDYRSTDNAGNVETFHTLSVQVNPQVQGTVGGSVPSTLALTVSTMAPSLGTLTPGVTQNYQAEIALSVISTAGSSTLSVTDPSSTQPGHLVNGAFFLPQALQAKATDAANPSSSFAPIGGSPLTLLTYSGPTSNDPVALTFQQQIASTDAMRTGTYSKTLVLTLSTTSP
jgi:hypothetical protein